MAVLALVAASFGVWAYVRGQETDTVAAADGQRQGRGSEAAAQPATTGGSDGASVDSPTSPSRGVTASPQETADESVDVSPSATPTELAPSREEGGSRRAARGPTPFWTVIAVSAGDAEGGRPAAREVASQLRQSGYPSQVFFSSEHSSLRPGYWVAVTGHFDESTEAARLAEEARAAGFSTAYPRCVGTAEQCS